MSRPNRDEILIRMPPEVNQALQKYAEKLDISRNQLAINLLKDGLDDLRLLQASGLLIATKGIRDLANRIRRGDIKPDNQPELPI